MIQEATQWFLENSSGHDSMRVFPPHIPLCQEHWVEGYKVVEEYAEKHGYPVLSSREYSNKGYANYFLIGRPAIYQHEGEFCCVCHLKKEEK
jgi:hypothetical protein